MIQSIILIIWRVHISPRGFTCCMHNALIRLTEGYTQIKRTVHGNAHFFKFIDIFIEKKILCRTERKRKMIFEVNEFCKTERINQISLPFFFLCIEMISIYNE